MGGASYLPGEGLLRLPRVSMIDDDEEDDGEDKGQVGGSGMPVERAGCGIDDDEVKGLPPLKRAKLMADVSTVPSSRVKRNEGGRGKERFRTKKGICGVRITCHVQCEDDPDVGEVLGKWKPDSILLQLM